MGVREADRVRSRAGLGVGLRSRAKLWGQIRKRAEGVKSRTGLLVRFDQRGSYQRLAEGVRP